MAVTPNDIADRLGLPRPAGDSPKFLQWQGFIEDAYRLIERYQTANSLPAPSTVDLDYVVKEAVSELVQRPDKAATVDMSVDDGRVSKTYRDSGLGRLDLSDWWSYLWPGDASSSEAFTIRPYYEPPAVPW